jgi:hypothetical protein
METHHEKHRNEFTSGISEAFVTKLKTTGSALVYSTYLGGGLNDEGRSSAAIAYTDAAIVNTSN